MFTPSLLALLIGAACAAVWWRTRSTGRKGALVLAGAWLLYAGYEFLMFKRVLCSGECNIRVDLLLFYPALALATLGLLRAMLLRALQRRAETP